MQPFRNVSSLRLGRLLLTLTLASGLSACAMNALAPPQAQAPGPSAAQAQKAYAQGHYGQAAQLYLKVAQRAPAAQRPSLHIKAAQAALKANDAALARKALAGVSAQAVSGSTRLRLDLVQARLDLAENQPHRALQRLPGPGARVPTALVPQIWRTRAQALFALGRTLAATRALVQRGKALQSPGARRANDKLLWQQLQKAPLTGGAVEGWRQANPAVRGWIHLARISQNYYFQPQALQSHLQAWLNRYPHHPAAATVVPRLRRTAGGNKGYPQQIALLLPLAGKLSAPAQAIRDGFLTAYYQQSGTRPSVRIYVTHPGKGDAARLFHQAVSDGANVVVGPLAAPAVQAVAGADSGTTPVLALNYLKGADKPPSDFYQMGLSPGDEARQVARRASADGLHRALALVPAGHWGNRVLQAFRKALSAQGGQVVDFARYNPSQADHSQSIIYLLGLNPKTARHRDKAKLKPRTDADFIFVAATPKQGRLIRPELRFYNATGIPVYATSSVYAGHPQPKKDVDMDGMRFCDMPWLLLPQAQGVAALRRAADNAWSDVQRRQPRLLALGVDAYRVIPALTSGAMAQGHTFPGVTGQLSLSPDQRIARSLPCARFHNGRPQPLQQAGAGSSSGSQ